MIRRWSVLFLLGMGILGLDFWSKGLVVTHLQEMNSIEYPYGGIPVFQGWGGIDFAVVHVVNRGVAWGWLAEFSDYLPYLRIAILIGLLIHFYRTAAGFLYRSALILVMAGACGNVIDYFRYHHVIDMFYFVFWGYSYPVFNLADSAIFCGVMGLFFHSWLRRRQEVYD